MKFHRNRALPRPRTQCFARHYHDALSQHTTNVLVKDMCTSQWFLWLRSFSSFSYGTILDLLPFGCQDPAEPRTAGLWFAIRQFILRMVGDGIFICFFHDLECYDMLQCASEHYHWFATDITDAVGRYFGTVCVAYTFVGTVDWAIRHECLVHGWYNWHTREGNNKLMLLNPW